MNIISFCRNLATAVQHCEVWYKGPELVLQTVWDEVLAGARWTSGIRQPRQLCGPRRSTQWSICYWTLLWARTFGFVSFLKFVCHSKSLFHSKDCKTYSKIEKQQLGDLSNKEKHYFSYININCIWFFSQFIGIRRQYIKRWRHPLQNSGEGE